MSEAKSPKLPKAEVHLVRWDGAPSWSQYHDESDPLPAKWDDDEPDEVQGFYSGDQMHSMYLQGRREALEEAAKECEEEKVEVTDKDDEAYNFVIDRCAAAIRELSKEKE